MRFYTQQHRFYCGIDLHARLLAVCVLDQAGNIVVQTQLPAEKQLLLDMLAPFRPDVVVAVECLFAWYWVADLCQAEGIPFVLGHALYMKYIHGGKAKNDNIDAEKIGRLLKGGNIPVAYVYPKGLRETLELVGFTALTRRGPQLCGPCPVHGSSSRRSRSFAAHLERRCWHCFGCGAGGNALDLYLAVTKLPIYQAALELCARLHLPAPWRAQPASRRPP